jgi:hypothetical protein
MAGGSENPPDRTMRRKCTTLMQPTAMAPTSAAISHGQFVAASRGSSAPNIGSTTAR